MMFRTITTIKDNKLRGNDIKRKMTAFSAKTSTALRIMRIHPARKVKTPAIRSISGKYEGNL
jgi:hypothetical protein